MNTQVKGSLLGGDTHRGEFIAKNHASGPVSGSAWYLAFGKRALDIAFVLMLVPIALPFVAISALLTALIDGHNPFYRQDRVGLKGKTFRILKLRTMVPDADAKLEEYLAANPKARAEWDSKQKLDHDPRITAFGNFFRKSSMDELPQLWNVLKGEMSVVGPRPMMDKQRDLYVGRAYYGLRPGITGSWQISDRNDCDFAQRAEFDEAYGEDVSLRNDLGILLRTVLVVLRCTGR